VCHGKVHDKDLTKMSTLMAAARRRMAAKGEPWGRPPRMTVKERESARRMREQGRSVREISAALGVPKSTIGRLLAPKSAA